MLLALRSLWESAAVTETVRAGNRLRKPRWKHPRVTWSDAASPSPQVMADRVTAQMRAEEEELMSLLGAEL